MIENNFEIAPRIHNLFPIENKKVELSYSGARISVDGGVTYSITPAMGGIMKDYYGAYGADIVTGQFKDICGDIKNAVVHDGWNNIASYTGSIDEMTGVITIEFANNWGDNAVMTLTPQ